LRGSCVLIFGYSPDATNPGAAAFEELCRAHIRSFAKGAEKYATETNLTKRVGQWQSRLAPILDEEERRPEFDIYKYGARVISGVQNELSKRNNEIKLSSSVAKPSNAINFHAITRNCEQYEVCRLFLASLSLSNSGNVIFTAETGKVMTPDSLQIQLLESNVDRPMETFLAPSAAAIAAAGVN
jgi:condensin-2 complex subunit H2